MKDMVKVLQLQQTIKTLQNENETLKNIIKEELYEEFMEYVDIREDNKKLKELNKRLRAKLREYQSKDYKKEK